MRKKIAGLFLTVVFLFTAIFPVVPAADAKVLSPGDPGVRTAKFWVGKPYYEVNGVKHEMDVAPYVQDGRTLLPVRYVGYALGISEKDIDWNSAVQQAPLKRWYGTGEFDYDEITFRTGDDRSKADYILNGWDYTAKLDVPAQVAPPGRIMVPFRAAVHALGGLAFWDGHDKSVTVVTWEKPPAPVEQTIYKVQCTLEKPEADVTCMDGTSRKVKTAQPVFIGITRPNGNPGYMINAIEWLKLWGIPEKAILFDPVRGGLAVRGAATHNNPLYGFNRKTTTYCTFYVGDKQLWEGFFDRYPKAKGEIKSADPIYVKNGTLYGDIEVIGTPWHLWRAGGSGSFDGEDENTTLTVTAE